MREVVFVDTSAFFALQNSGDSREHRPVRAELDRLKGAPLSTSDYILDETYTLLRAHLGHQSALDFGEEIRRGGIDVVQVDESIQEEAWRIFARYSDKDFSFTDCTSFAIMERARIRTAFSLDHHFRQYGFETIPAGPLAPAR